MPGAGSDSSHGSLYHRLPVEIRGPVNQVEGPKQHRKHDPGHLVDLAHAVVGLFGVGGLGFGRFELHRCAVGDGGDGRVLAEVGCVIHAGRAGVVWLFGKSQGVFFLGTSETKAQWFSLRSSIAAGFRRNEE